MMISSLAMGGTERNMVSVAPYVRDQGVNLSLVSLNIRRDSPLADEFAQTGIPRFDLQANRMLDLNAWRRFTTMLREEQVQVIHAQDQDTIIYAGLARRRLGIPSVMSRHVLFEPTDTLKEKVRAQMVLTAAKFGYDKIITVSEAVRQDFSQRAGIPLERIETIYNGLDVGRFHIQTPKKELRASLGWEADAPTIIMVAILRRGKGHEVLFEAMPKILETLPDVKVRLVGDGEIAAEIRKMAAQLGNSIDFLGQRTDVPQLLAASDVLVLPSWAEALPTVLIEAGAAGLPAVSTDVGGAKEITLDGKTGYIVPPGDANALASRLIELLENRNLAEAMGERARARVQATFSLRQQAAQFKDLYERLSRA